MAWEWSHTHEAYRDAELNLRDLDDATLAVIWAEWQASKRSEWEWEFNSRKYDKALRKAYSLIRRGHREGMEDEVWERASDLATCTNGGWQAWLCPHGCGCHMVPFDRDEEHGS